MRAGPLLVTLALLAVPGFAHEAPSSLVPHLLDHLVVTPDSHPNLPLREISGLAWDAQRGVLLALSDRNILYNLSPGSDRDRIDLTLTARSRLSDATGTRLLRRDFTAEGIALSSAQPGVVAIISEVPPRLAQFDRRGRHLRDLPLPPALRERALLRSMENGLESLALHPRLGYLVAPEVPLAGQPRRTHVIYNAGGPVLAYRTGAAGQSSIKAMETLPDGRLLVLERDRLDAAHIVVFLRIIDPAVCSVAFPCAPPAARLDLPPPLDADFEALAWLGDGRVLIASDDRDAERRFRTVFALLDLGLASGN